MPKAAGRYSRAARLRPEQIAEAHEKVSAGVPKAKATRELGVTGQTPHAALKGDGVYVDGEAAEELV